MFVAEKDGSFLPVKTLYKPDKIIAVQSSNLESVYIENIDYIVKEEGILPLIGTAMSYFKYNQYYLDIDTIERNFQTADGRIIYDGGSFFHNKQIWISYTHSEKWNGPVVKNKRSKLPETHKKIKDKKEINILFNGDSITTGDDSSGKQLNAKPHLPPFPDMFVQKIEKEYNIKVNMANIAAGGTNAEWGIKQSIGYLSEDKNIKPDLYVIAFGMNDGSCKIPADTYISNIRKIINNAKKICPHCEFILIATMLPNPNVPGFAGPHLEYEKTLLDLENELSGIAVADMTEIHGYLLTKKRYQDITGNNGNHPNDFLARIYAQVLLKTFGI